MQKTQPSDTLSSHCNQARRQWSDVCGRLLRYARGLIDLVSARVVRSALVAGIGLFLVCEPVSGFIPMTPTMRFEKSDQTETLAIRVGPETGDDGGPVVIRSSDSAPKPAAAPPPQPESESSWRFRWMGWEGVDFEIQETTSFKNPAALTSEADPDDISFLASHFSVEHLTFHARIGIRTDVDLSHFFKTGNTGGDSTQLGLRRFRVLTKGDFHLLLPVAYQLELGYVPNTFYIENMYIAMEDLKWIGELKFGQYTASLVDACAMKVIHRLLVRASSPIGAVY